MIDTIILTIPKDKVYPTSSGYSNRTWDLQSKTAQYEKYVRNPSAVRQPGVYLPRLTYIKRKIKGSKDLSVFLKVEFSAPKLIYGNNLDELEEAEFPKVAGILKAKLGLMGVGIDMDGLKQATVSAFHASKNVRLVNDYTASLVVSELSKINLNKKFDLDKTNFRNNGTSLQGYTVAHSVVFYDKVADLAQNKKRAIDKDQTPQQLPLFAEIKTRDARLEIIRMEVRLSQKQKMNSVLQQLGFKKDPTFADLFKNNLCQKVVRFYWDTLIKAENLFLFELANTPQQLLKEVLRKHKKIGAKEAVYLVGLKLLCRDEGGVRELRKTLTPRLTQRSWYRFNDGIKLLNKGSGRKRHQPWFKQIEDAIAHFEAYRIGTGPPE